MYLLGVNETLVTDEPVFRFGARALKEDGKEYCYVRWIEATDAVAGEFCAWTTNNIAVNSSFQNDGFAVTSDYNTDTANIGAGVLQAAMTLGQCGWIQTKGLATMTPDISGLTAGSLLTVNGAADGTLVAVDGHAEVPCAVAKAGSIGLIIVQGIV